MAKELKDAEQFTATDLRKNYSPDTEYLKPVDIEFLRLPLADMMKRVKQASPSIPSYAYSTHAFC